MTISRTEPIRRTGEPRLASIASWAVLIASFGLSASTWIALARLAGFTDTITVPTVNITLALAWLMPIAVDGYVVVALVLWMSPVPTTVAAFAKKNTYLAAGIGIAAQSAYHLLSTMSATNDDWRVAMAAIVGAIPPAVAALAVHMRALIRRESQTATTSTAAVTARPDIAPSTTAALTPIPVPSPVDTATPSLADTAAPSTTNTQPSPADTAPVKVPAAAPTPIPTPATVAARITQPRPTNTPANPAAVSRPDPRTTKRPRSIRPAPTAPTLAPSSTDTPVTASDAAQLELPVAPDLLARAAQVARQYRTEHGTPITPGQLAVRLKVTSDTATQALAVLDLGPDSPTTPTPTVNGNPVKATR
jgi:hypothetical protein